MVDAESGEYITDSEGRVRPMEGGILVRWDEVEYLDITE
jgi:hypothetical protein